MTASDMTNQMAGPYQAAVAATPAGVAIARRTRGANARIARNTAENRPSVTPVSKPARISLDIVASMLVTLSSDELDRHDSAVGLRASGIRHRVLADLVVNQRDRPVRRLLSALDHRARTGPVGEGFLARVAQFDYVEACGREAAARFVCGREKARLGAACPRRWKVQRGAATFRNLGKHQPRAGLQHARDLTMKSGLVGDVHRHVHRVGAVEGRVGERHLQRVGGFERDAMGEAEQPREMTGYVAELRRQIDACDTTSEARRNVASRS